LNTNDSTASSSPVVLLIDDNEDILMVIKMSLELLGYEVATSSNGTEALESFAQLKPNIAIIDQGLPDIRGLEVGRQIKELCGEQKCALILLTGTDGPVLRTQATEAGFDDFLVKPVRVNILSNCIKRQLEKP